MKLAGSTLTFRRLSLADAVARLRRLGFDTLDLCCIFPSYCPHFDPTAAGRDRLLNLQDLLRGLRISTLNVGLASWNSSDRAIRSAQSEFVVGSLRVAKALGAYAVTVQSGTRPRTATDWSAAARLAADTIRPVAKLAELQGVPLSLEIHLGMLAETVEEAEQLLDLIKSPVVGVTLDTSHLAARGADPAAAIERLGARVQQVHLRDAKPGNPLVTPGDGLVDFGAVGRALQKIGYGRSCTVELEFGVSPATVADIEEQLRRACAHLDQAFAPKPQ